MSCIQQNFPSKFEPNDAFYEKLEENTFVAFILKHPVVAWFTRNKATRKLIASLKRLMYGPVHFQGPGRDEQF